MNNENVNPQQENEENFTEQEVFDFLDDLRESGVVNMLEATYYIMKEFGVNNVRGRQLLVDWMEQFGSRD